LILAAKDMSIILGKTSDPKQAMENAAPLVPVNCAKFGPAQGQFTVGSLPRFVSDDMKGQFIGLS